jgi:hypothetical protein
MYVAMACISIVFIRAKSARTSRPSIFLRDDTATTRASVHAWSRLDATYPTLIGRSLRTPCRATGPLIGEVERSACCGPRVVLLEAWGNVKPTSQNPSTPP